ncbi:MAG: reactive intermediate/imine deaminase [Deltaproteobacteria bacterium]|nr:MAG: reactive intermediate/imine deaminase [Deltaproteobacteria bacterium]TMQ18618.1 MAG: reactive intermediate/imine deaminase [Deltaproteobacteria bacterium]
MTTKRSIIRTAHAPAAIGPYSQAVVVPMGGQRMVFCSGQIALDPKTGAVIEGDVSAQARQVLENLGAVLAAAGATFANVVKTTIFLADMADFATVNAIYGERFPNDPPARATVAAAGLPRNARVEIDAIAVL